MRTGVLAFLIGVVAVQWRAQLPALDWLLAATGLVAIVVWHRPRLSPVLFLLLGVVWTTWRADLVLRESLPESLAGTDLIVTGYIADLPQANERGVRFRFDVDAARLANDTAAATVAIPRRLQLNSYDPHFEPQVGARWRLTVRLRQPHGMVNPGGFDYEAYLFRNRIRATGYVRADPPPQALAPAGVGYAVNQARAWLGARLRAAAPGDPFVPLAIAFVNGDDRAVAPAQWEILQRTGTAHLLAISGMNIGLLAGIAFFVVRWLWALAGLALRWPAPKAGAVAGLIAACVYAALAGFAIPTQRALIMVTVVMLALLRDRLTAPSRVLALALALVLLHDPLSALSAGFWLSFVSVAIIAWVVADRVSAPWWRQFGRVQLAISAGLLPLTIVLFQQVPLAGPIANLLAIPVIELAVIPLSLLGAAFAALHFDAPMALALAGATAILQGLWYPLTALANIESLQWTQPAPPVWALGLAILGALWLIAPRGWPARGLGVVLMLPMLLLPPARPAHGELWFSLLDVGQGLAAVARTHTHTLVFDAGPRLGARFDTGRAVVSPYLRHAGVTAVDMLIVSHGDNDHIGGVASLRTDYPPRAILSGAPARLADALPCRAGQRWQWDGVDFELLAPSATDTQAHPVSVRARDNDGSCVLRIASAWGGVLLPADIEARTEAELVQRLGASLATAVLVAPHHGSKTSSTPEFIAGVAPRIVLFPSGYKNPYRHPHPDVVARYAARGITAAVTGESGAIEMRIDAAGITLRREREHARRFWYTR